MILNFLKDLINSAIFGYNSSIHSSTGFTLVELVFDHRNSRNPDGIFIPKKVFTNYAQNRLQKLVHVYEKVRQK